GGGAQQARQFTAHEPNWLGLEPPPPALGGVEHDPRAGTERAVIEERHAVFEQKTAAHPRAEFRAVSPCLLHRPRIAADRRRDKAAAAADRQHPAVIARSRWGSYFALPWTWRSAPRGITSECPQG